MIKTKLVLCVVICTSFAVTGLAADEDTTALIHPQVVEDCLKTSTASNLTLQTSTNPYYLRGDFDGDRKPDYAVAVKGIKTKRNGILFCLASKEVFVVGADLPLDPPFSDMPNDNFVAPNWAVYAKSDVAALGKFRTNVPRPLPKVAGEAVAMIWEDGIALIYWDGHQFRWAGSKN